LSAPTQPETVEIQRGEVNDLGDGQVFVMRSTADSIVLGINVVDEEQPALELRAGDYFQVGATEWKVIEVVDLGPIPDYCPPGWRTGAVAARVEQVPFRSRAVPAPGWRY
jgi:hypothetical protein